MLYNCTVRYVSCSFITHSVNKSFLHNAQLKIIQIVMTFPTAGSSETSQLFVSVCQVDGMTDLEMLQGRGEGMRVLFEQIDFVGLFDFLAINKKHLQINFLTCVQSAQFEMSYHMSYHCN